MALSNLRTGITVRQERITTFPNVQASVLPAVLIGVNRELTFQNKAELLDWSAGTAVSGAPFPGYTSGRVEAGVINPTLAPAFFVSNSLGLSDITDKVTVNNIGSGSTGAPTFDIASGFSAVFDITSGFQGCFKVDNADATLSEFSDPAADFIFSEVRRGDAILVNGVQDYEVTGIVSDNELDVRRIGKGPETIGVTEASKLVLTPEDTNDFRKLISTSTSFVESGGWGPEGTKVTPGDIVRIDNWDSKFSSEGIIFSAEGEEEGTVLTAAGGSARAVLADERTVTFPTASVTTPAAFNPLLGSGTVVFTTNQDDELVPAMYLVTTVDVSLTAPVKTYGVSALLPTSDSDLGAGFQAVVYSLPSGTTVGSSTGSFTAVAGGTRTFTDTLGAGSLFAANVVASGAVRSHVLIKDAEGALRPAFEVTATPGAGITELIVTDLVTGEIPATAFANNVEYVVMSFDSGAAAEFVAGGVATVSATFGDTPGSFGSWTSAEFDNYVLTVEDRLLTDAAADFVAEVTPPVIGDYIFSDTGIAMFQIMSVPLSGVTSTTQLIVRNARNAGTLLTGADTLANFGYSVRIDSKRADFLVQRVIDAGTLEVSALPNSPNQISGTSSVQGSLWFQDESEPSPSLATSVIVRDNRDDIAYTVQKTVSGGQLAGDVLVSYAVVRDDLIGLQDIQADEVASRLGDDVPDNPLGLGARIYFSNTSQTLKVIQVKEDTLEGWQAAAEAAKTDEVYNIVPLTQDPSVLAMWRAHVIDESTPDNKRERVLWQSEAFPRDQVRATTEADDVVTVSRTAEGDQTVVINRDLVAAGVLTGDNFEGVMFNGAVYTKFAGRILDVTLAGSTTTLTILPDGLVLVSTVDMAVSSFTVTQRPLSPAEIKDEVAAYPATIQNRRIRNIYPDACRIEFSDNTGDGETDGFYGGGTLISTEGGHYMCIPEVAKRLTFGPARPLTKRGGAGVYQVLDSFTEQPGFQDAIIDSGNYYMEQRGGLGTNVQTIRALTTDVRELITAEESVTSQIDSFVRRLRRNLTPLLGPEILDVRFFDLVSTSAQSVVTRVLNDKELKTIRFLSISEDPESADSFKMDYEVEPFFSGARGLITIYF